MSYSLLFHPKFGSSRQRNVWFWDKDAWATTLAHQDDDAKVDYSFIDFLASGETVSSATYEDSGITTSAKSIATPVVTFTITGIGETKLTIATSASRNETVRFRTYLAEGHGVHDYND